MELLRVEMSGVISEFCHFRLHRCLFISRALTARIQGKESRSVRMAHVYVRSVDEEDRMLITMTYTVPRSDKARIYNLFRLKHEPLSAALSKLATNITALMNRKTKKKRKKKVVADADATTTPPGGDEEEAKEVSIYLQSSGVRVDEETENVDAWKSGSILNIETSTEKTAFPILINAPAITKLKLPSPALVNYPIRPLVELEFVTEDHVRYIWYRSKTVTNVPPCEPEVELAKPMEAEGCTKPVADGQCTPMDAERCVKPMADGHSTPMEVDPSRPEQEAFDNENVDKPSVSGNCDLVATTSERTTHAKRIKKKHNIRVPVEWEEVSQGRLYTPSPEDVGHKLKLKCIPCNETIEGRAVESDDISVQSSPQQCPFEKRHSFTSEVTPDTQMRTVSYNILADMYADSNFSRDFLFPQCPPEALSFDYRKQLLLKEIIGYNADIICLQEVGKKFFLNGLQRALDEEGLKGLLCVKPAEVGEGCATFYRADKLRYIASHDINMMEALKQDAVHYRMRVSLATNTELQTKVMERKAVLQVTALETTDGSGRVALVATTHLYFHPRAGNIRLIQTSVCINHLQKIKQEYKDKGVDAAVIFCGDFNSDNDYGVCKFILEKHLHSKHADWFSNGKAELLQDVTLSHDLDLVSACGRPAYTNYVVSFFGCLDHIFYETKRLKVKQIIPLPSHEDVTKHTALPNQEFPSDHLALVCDLEWKKVS